MTIIINSNGSPNIISCASDNLILFLIMDKKLRTKVN